MIANVSLFGDPERTCATALIPLALLEDLGPSGLVGGDITGTATIPSSAQGLAVIRPRSSGVVSGLPIVAMLCERMGLTFEAVVPDGHLAAPGEHVAVLRGDMRSILAAERTALNFLQRLSGIASLTSQFVKEVAGTKAQILDTRKTTPGWRSLEKYAVRCGGGRNHRIGLYDAVLIKDNHLAWLAHEPDAIGRAIASARRSAPQASFLEIEVDSLVQLDRALACGPDIILVDNLGPEQLIEAVRRRDQVAPQVLLESSGGITLDTVRDRALSGVDRISVGALTHSAPALDLGLDFGDAP